MIVAENQIEGTNCTRYLLVNKIDETNRKKAIKLFFDYKNRGVLTNNSYDDDVWILNDQRKCYKIFFNCDELCFHKFAKEWLGCTYDCYKDAEKVYIVFKLGLLSLETLRDIVVIFNYLGESDVDTALDITKYVNHIIELLYLIPGGATGRDYVAESLEEKSIHFEKKSKQRRLADFKSYFRFHDELKKYWANAKESEKLYYFPLYLWWNLTAILPLRPSEFLLTPRDCLSEKNDNYFITVRRTKLKGGHARLSYCIEGDFKKYIYPVNSDIANEIIWYKQKTEHMHVSPIGTLFCKEASLVYHNHGSIDYNSIYNYGNLDSILKMFYKNVLNGKDISQIHLGDTRHIAMMNLIISGGSPVMCMELAGHDDISISSHYYSNMSSLVECATYELYRKAKAGGQAYVYGENKYNLTPLDKYIKIKNGWCCSNNRKIMKVDDCVLAVNNAGEIGDCFYCKYFRSDMQGVHFDYYDLKKNKEEVDADSWFLMHMINAVRTGIGMKEDIQTALLKLQNSCSNYREHLMNDYIRGEKNV